MLFEDMSAQLITTIALHYATRELTSLLSKKDSDSEKVTRLREEVKRLRASRRCAPPRVQQRGNKVILTIPFLSASGELLDRVLQQGARLAYAGVDRGLRCPVVVSVLDEDSAYHDRQVRYEHLFTRRTMLRQRTRELSSQIDRRKNNWERKRPRLTCPAHILKRERELTSVWRKVRRLDREIAHQVAAETVWFCEKHGVKTVYLEDLRFFNGKGGMRSHSWNLSTNLWGLIQEGIIYRRKALGHSRGGVWTVNPAWTSQTCSECGERGVRVEGSESVEERKGGEYFYCPQCQTQLHADINAARNIIKVRKKPSAGPGRTGQQCPEMSNFQ